MPDAARVTAEALKPEALILGIDPAIGLRKPMAMMLVQFGGGETRALNWCDGRIVDRYVKDRISVFSTVMYAMLWDCRNKHDRYPDMVAIEDVRARGRGGSHLETLVTCLCEEADALGIRCERINPKTVKLAAVGDGNAGTEKVAVFMRAECKGMEGVPIVAGEYDIEMACAVAGAGYAIMKSEALGALAK